MTVAAVPLFSGCSGSSNDTPKGTHEDTGRLADRFETALRTADIDVESLEIENQDGGRVAELSYTTETRTRRGVGEDIGVVAGVYAEAVDDGWKMVRLNVTVLKKDDGRIGEYIVRSAWAQEWIDDDMSDEEYTGRVAETLRLTSELTSQRPRSHKLDRVVMRGGHDDRR
jgi:hypothetical protein